MERFYAWSPYNLNFRNSVKLSDPEGDCPPWICGAIAGAALDVGIQVFIEGKSLSEVNYTEVAISAAAGAVGAGIIAKASKLIKVTKNSDKIIKATVRKTRGKGKGVRVETKSGKIKDITKDRVKQFEPEPRNPNKGIRQIDFKKEPSKLPKNSNILKNSKGKKRTPTKKELNLLKKAKNKNTDKP